MGCVATSPLELLALVLGLPPPPPPPLPLSSPSSPLAADGSRTSSPSRKVDFDPADDMGDVELEVGLVEVEAEDADADGAGRATAGESDEGDSGPPSGSRCRITGVNSDTSMGGTTSRSK